MGKQYFLEVSESAGECLCTVYLRWSEAGKFVSTYGPYSAEDVTECAALASVVRELEAHGYEHVASIFE